MLCHGLHSSSHTEPSLYSSLIYLPCSRTFPAFLCLESWHRFKPFPIQPVLPPDMSFLEFPAPAATQPSVQPPPPPGTAQPLARCRARSLVPSLLICPAGRRAPPRPSAAQTAGPGPEQALQKHACLHARCVAGASGSAVCAREIGRQSVPSSESDRDALGGVGAREGQGYYFRWGAQGKPL